MSVSIYTQGFLHIREPFFFQEGNDSHELIGLIFWSGVSNEKEKNDK